MSTAQLNMRIPATIKDKAQKKAEDLGSNLNFIIKLFLVKFISDTKIVEIQQDVLLENIFDTGIKKHLSSKKWQKQIRNINKLLEEIS